jgi:hypothetical protein
MGAGACPTAAVFISMLAEIDIKIVVKSNKMTVFLVIMKVRDTDRVWTSFLEERNSFTERQFSISLIVFGRFAPDMRYLTTFIVIFHMISRILSVQIFTAHPT